MIHVKYRTYEYVHTALYTVQCILYTVVSTEHNIVNNRYIYPSHVTCVYNCLYTYISLAMTLNSAFSKATLNVVPAKMLVKMRHVFLRFYDALSARLVDLRVFLMDQWLEKAWRCESTEGLESSAVHAVDSCGC